MAHGGPDYWEQASPGLPVPGVEQTLWYAQDSRVIAGGANVVVVDYTTPAAQGLFITGGVISSDFARIQRYNIMLDLLVLFDQYFDTFAPLPFNPSAMLPTGTGVRFRFRIYNDDALAHIFSVFILGFLVNIVPGIAPPIGLGLLIPGAGV